MTRKTSRIAYAVHCGPGRDEGRVILVEEGVQGYKTVPDYDCSPVLRRKGIAQRLNKRLGVSQKRVNILVAHSMLGAR